MWDTKEEQVVLQGPDRVLFITALDCLGDLMLEHPDTADAMFAHTPYWKDIRESDKPYAVLRVARALLTESFVAPPLRAWQDAVVAVVYRAFMVYLEAEAENSVHSALAGSKPGDASLFLRRILAGLTGYRKGMDLGKVDIETWHTLLATVIVQIGVRSETLEGEMDKDAAQGFYTPMSSLVPEEREDLEAFGDEIAAEWVNIIASYEKEWDCKLFRD